MSATEGEKKIIPACQIDKKKASFNTTNCLYLAKKASGNPFKRSSISPYALAVKTAIENSTRRIDIMTPNLNENGVIQALADALARGVQINLLLGKHHNEKDENRFFLGGDNQKAVQHLFKAIHKRGDRHLDKLNIHWAALHHQILKNQDPQTLHAKMVCVDDVLLAGSSVLDKQSAYHSREGDICVQSQAIADDYRRQIFEPIFDEGVAYCDDPENKMISSCKPVLN